LSSSLLTANFDGDDKSIYHHSLSSLFIITLLHPFEVALPPIQPAENQPEKKCICSKNVLTKPTKAPLSYPQAIDLRQ
jgi:hypothetical protein